jgi:glutamyl-tRNA synthetase
LLAWLCARKSDGQFLVRFEDLDRANSSVEKEILQLAELAVLGITHSPNFLRQSDRFDVYSEVLNELRHRDLLYPCYCSRREIREAIRAPHGEPSDGVYPGTCRLLTTSQRLERERSGRPPAWRLRTDGESYVFEDGIAGTTQAAAVDVVLQRNDGVPAYNLAVVVDDASQGITEIVRGDDLLPATGGHIHLQRLLGYFTPRYIHVPLVLGADGERLAKRHGAVTLEQLAKMGIDGPTTLRVLGASLNCQVEQPQSATELLQSFNLDLVPRSPWTIPNDWQTGEL